MKLLYLTRAKGGSRCVKCIRFSFAHLLFLDSTETILIVCGLIYKIIGALPGFPGCGFESIDGVVLFADVCMFVMLA